MATVLFVVILSQDNWWVDIEGRAHGPFATRHAATEEATALAQLSAHSGRDSEVLVPDDDGRYNVVWTSTEEQRPGFRLAASRAAE